MAAAVAVPVLPMKRARAAAPAAAPNGAHNDTHPDFTPDLAKMLGAYIAAYGELPSTESIPPPVIAVPVAAPAHDSRNLTLLAASPAGVPNFTAFAANTSIVNQDIPLVAGLKLHLEVSVDTTALSFSAKAQVKGIPFIGTVTIGNCNLGTVGQRCEFGYSGILHAALYIQGRSLKMDLEVAGNKTTINIVTV